MPRWIIEYVYEGADGKTRISIDRLNAPTKEEAIKKAAEIAPADEFLVSAYSESDEQFLGAVRGKAMAMSGKTGKNPELYENEE